MVSAELMSTFSKVLINFEPRISIDTTSENMLFFEFAGLCREIRGVWGFLGVGRPSPKAQVDVS